MTSIERFGLGTMGMNLGNKESSIKTIHTALDSGVTPCSTPANFIRAVKAKWSPGKP